MILGFISVCLEAVARIRILWFLAYRIRYFLHRIRILPLITDMYYIFMYILYVQEVGTDFI